MLSVFFLVISVFVPLAGAGSWKLSSSAICDRSLLHQTVSVGDEGQHTMSLDQRVCTWNPPLILEEMKSTQYTATGTDDIQFDRSHDRGYGVGAVENGDKYFLSYDGTSTMNGSVPIRLEGTWRFTSGTGSLARLQGSGTYKAKPTPDGKMVFEIEGEYALSGKHGK